MHCRRPGSYSRGSGSWKDSPSSSPAPGSGSDSLRRQGGDGSSGGSSSSRIVVTQNSSTDASGSGSLPLSGLTSSQYLNDVISSHERGSAGSPSSDRSSGRDTSSISFRLLFGKKITDLPGEQVNDSSSGSVLFSFAPSSKCLEGLFQLTWHSTRALNLALEIQSS